MNDLNEWIYIRVACLERRYRGRIFEARSVPNDSILTIKKVVPPHKKTLRLYLKYISLICCLCAFDWVVDFIIPFSHPREHGASIWRAAIPFHGPLATPRSPNSRNNGCLLIKFIWEQTLIFSVFCRPGTYRDEPKYMGDTHEAGRRLLCSSPLASELNTFFSQCDGYENVHKRSYCKDVLMCNNILNTHIEPFQNIYKHENSEK